VVDIDRFRRVLARTPTMGSRLFTEAEQAYAALHRDPVPRLAARFAAKEAAMKALGVGLGEVAFRDIEVTVLSSSAPELRVSGLAAARAAKLGVTGWKVSLTHGQMVAEAVVVAL
jgi:holo-[acyl-carrier protein] synthase